jgi:hypothetical protein
MGKGHKIDGRGWQWNTDCESETLNKKDQNISTPVPELP